MMTLNASGSTALCRCPPDSGDTYVEDSLVPGNVQPSHTVNIVEDFSSIAPSPVGSQGTKKRPRQ